MLFGRKNTFAIQCNLEKSNKSQNLNFGQIAIWIAEHQIGDFSLTVVLDTPIIFFQDSLKNCGSRKDEMLCKMNVSQIWKFLDSVLWGNDESFLDLPLSKIVELEEKYLPFNICTNFCESFDGESAFLIEFNQMEKFIWQDIQSKTIREINLTNGTYEKVVKSLLDWYFEARIFESSVKETMNISKPAPLV